MVNSTYAFELLRKILQGSDRIKVKKLRQALNLPESQFNNLISRLAERFGLRVDRNYIELAGCDIAGFITALDNELQQLENNIASEIQVHPDVPVPPTPTTRSNVTVNLDDLPNPERECLTELKKLTGEVWVILNQCHVERLSLSNKGLTTLPTSFEHLKHLKDLFLRGNNFTDIPSVISSLTSLKCLNFSCNQIKELPETIGELKNLEDLILVHNKLDHLPQCIGEMASLRRLWLGYNEFAQLPPSLARLTHLESLGVEGNLLTIVPAFLGEMRALKTIHLSQNFIVDIPNPVANPFRIALPGYIPFQIIQHTPSVNAPLNLILKYAHKIRSLPSFREVAFTVIYTAQNAGTASLFDVEFGERFLQPIFHPLATKNIKACIVSREGNTFNFISPERFTVENDEHIHLYGRIGQLDPGERVYLQYQVQADKPSAQVTYEPEISLRLKTFKDDSPRKISFNLPKIPVSHLRRKFRKGKEIKALSGEGNYEISLFVKNTGESNLEEMIIVDQVPAEFQHGRYSFEPEVEFSMDQDKLLWKIPDLFPGNGWSVTYQIWGIGEYVAKEAQFTL